MLPFSGELTIKQLLDAVKHLLGISVDWANFPDLGTSCGPYLSITIDQVSIPFKRKLSELTAEERAKIERLARIACGLTSPVSARDLEGADFADLRALIERDKDALAVMLSAAEMIETLQTKHAHSAGGLARAEQLRSGKPERNERIRARRDELVAAGEAVGDILAKLQVETGLSFKQLGRILE